MTSPSVTRTCAVCRAPGEKAELLRWVRDEQGEIFPDLLGRSFGRGAWVHPQKVCLERLIPGLSRSFKAPIVTSRPEAMRRLNLGAQHRVEQLLGSALRQKLLVFGGDETERAHSTGKLQLLLVANDAQAAVNKGFVQQAISAGNARSWGTKEKLGKLLGRGDVALVGVNDRGLAQRLFGAIAMALLSSAGGHDSPTPNSENELSREVE